MAIGARLDARTEVPFPDETRRVTGVLEQPWERCLRRQQLTRVVDDPQRRLDSIALLVAAGDEPRARRRAVGMMLPMSP
jgi:hypothetical protein